MESKLRVVDTNPNRQHIIDALKDHLRRAEAGEYRSVHICTFSAVDGVMHRESAGTYNVFETVAALEIAKHGIIAANQMEPT